MFSMIFCAVAVASREWQELFGKPRNLLQIACLKQSTWIIRKNVRKYSIWTYFLSDSFSLTLFRDMANRRAIGKATCSTSLHDLCIPRPGHVFVKFDGSQENADFLTDTQNLRGKSSVLSGRLRYMEAWECDLYKKNSLDSYEKQFLNSQTYPI